MNKNILRQKILKQRQAMSEVEWQTKSNLICERLTSLPLFSRSNTIFAYFSFRKEADLSPLFSLNKKWAFPRCVNKTLVWHLWKPGDSLTKDKYGIQTPLESAPVVKSLSTDLIIVPTVACDRQKYRLGYGGGFYDRLLSSPQGYDVRTIGVVFDFAYIDRLPIDSWDAKLDLICTETKFSSI